MVAMQRHSVERISHTLHAFSMRLVEIFNHRSAGITPRESLVFCVTLFRSDPSVALRPNQPERRRRRPVPQDTPRWSL